MVASETDAWHGGTGAEIPFVSRAQSGHQIIPCFPRRAGCMMSDDYKTRECIKSEVETAGRSFTM